MEARWCKIGSFRALVNPRLDSPALRASLAGIEELARGGGAALLQAGRNRTVRLRLETGTPGQGLDVVAKFFGRQSPAKDLWDRLHSTKARRTYEAALFLSCAGIGTTPPVACLERWRGARLVAGVFVSAYVDGAMCFKDHLVALWRGHAPYSDFHDAMITAARGIRALHDAGCVHGDLGNQNVFFTRRAPGLPFSDALFLDLNRARFSDAPASGNARARDLARICLPEKFLETFLRLYWDGEPPRSFLRACRFWRKLFRIHSATRKFRHPVRELRYVLNPETAPAQAPYPPASEQWVWDADAMRPAQVAGERRMLSFIEPAWRRELIRDSARMAQRLARVPLATPAAAGAEPPRPAMRLTVTETDPAAAVRLVAASGLDRVLVRFAMADGEEVVARRLAVAKALAAAGHGIAVQVLQRPEFLGGESVESFAGRMLDGCGFVPDWVCVGQGINTLAWGIRSAAERDRLVAAGRRVAKSSPVVAAAVESPVLQMGCGGISVPAGEDLRFSAMALAWREGSGALDSEAATLGALAEEMPGARGKVIVISDTPLGDGEIASLPGCVCEICSTRFG